MSNLLLTLLTVIARREKTNFLHQIHHTDQVQEQFLLKLLQTYQHTELGQQWGIGEIRTVDQFRDRVPVLPYHYYEEYTERIFQGETNLLTPDPVVYLNQSSGTTGARKLIPVTRRFQNSLRRANLASIGFLVDALQNRNDTFGRMLLTNSANVFGQAPSGIPYGPASVGVLRMGKFLYEQLFANPFETLLLEDSPTRHYVALLVALRDRTMRGIIANFPMLVLRICDYLERYAEELIHDIKQGTLAPWLDLEPDVRRMIERRWSAQPERARELQVLLQSNSHLTPKLAWPHLSFIGTSRGGTSDFYFQRFPTYFDETPVFGAVYSSSEATFGIYPDVNTDGSILAIESGFFEFVPEDQWGTEHPKTLLATEVQIGARYRILSTNYSGFYRYDIGDVVEVVGFYEQAPLIVFRYRVGGLLSSTTEKTTEYHVTQVMQAIQNQFDLVLEDFCFTLSESVPFSHYLVNIELRAGQSVANPHSVIASIDHELQRANTSYRMRRAANLIPPPRLRLLAPGSFATLRQRQVERGMPDSQLKFPHVSEDRQFLAGLVVEQEVEISDRSQVSHLD